MKCTDTKLQGNNMTFGIKDIQYIFYTMAS